jgi:hypothetical protein
MSARQLQRVRRICLAFPEATERLSHGEPTFFVNKRVFAMLSNNHHGDGHVAVVVPAPADAQSALIARDPETFYRPPYVGGKGWVGIELPRIDDTDLRFHLETAWRMVAPKRLLS